MLTALTPVDRLLVGSKNTNGPQYRAIYGGYANPSGLISLLAEGQAYRINFKARTVQQKPLLNPGAQARYDAAKPGEGFEYGGLTFRRLAHDEIIEICASGSFRMGVNSR